MAGPASDRLVSSLTVKVAGRVLTGASLTAVTLKVMVLGEASVFWPPLAVPPLSMTWKVNDARPLPVPLAGGCQVRVPRLAAAMIWPAVTALAPR